MAKISRNQPCPCGSGKKYKVCCLGREDKPSLDPLRYHQKCLGISASLIDKVLSFINKQDYDRFRLKAFEEYWAYHGEDYVSRGDDGEQFNLFLEWFVHDFVVPGSNKTILDLYADGKPLLSADERTTLDQWRMASLSVFQVVEITPGLGATVEDILGEDTFFMTDVALSSNIRKWGLFLARKLPILDEFTCSSVVVTIPPKHREEIVALVLARYDDYKLEHPEADFHTFQHRNSNYIKWVIDHLNEREQALELHTALGEDLVFMEAHYEVENHVAVAKKLSRLSDMDIIEVLRDDDGITPVFKCDWLCRGPSARMMKNKERSSGVSVVTTRIDEDGGQTIVLGDLTLRNQHLVLECQGEERLAQGKRRLEKALGDLIRHRSDSRKSYEELSKQKPATPPSQEDEIPDEVKARLLVEVLDRHFHNWLDMPLPVLDGLSPRQAVETAKGRRQVESLIRNMEYNDIRNRLQVDYDVSWLRAELGLD